MHIVNELGNGGVGNNTYSFRETPEKPNENLLTKYFRQAESYRAMRLYKVYLFLFVKNFSQF